MKKEIPVQLCRLGMGQLPHWSLIYWPKGMNGLDLEQFLGYGFILIYNRFGLIETSFGLFSTLILTPIDPLFMWMLAETGFLENVLTLKR